MGVQGLQDCPPLAVPQTAVAGGPATADNQVLTESGHPIDWSADWANWTGDTFHSQYADWDVDLDEVGAIHVKGRWTQTAAVADGAMRVYNNTTSTAFTPTSITIPQGTTVVVDQVFTKDAGASGVDEIQLQHKSGESGVQMRRHAGVVGREVFA